jgi:sugar diacid utilization regulator
VTEPSGSWHRDAMGAQRRGRRQPRSAGLGAEVRQDWRAQVAQAAANDAGGLNPELLGGFLDRLADSGGDRGWDRQQRAGFVALGSRAAEQGVLLRAVVDLYLSAAWRAWSLLPAVASDDAAAVRRAGLQVLRACDDVVAAVAEGFTAARRAMVRREESLRREFVDDLLSGTADPARLLTRSEAYGLQLGGSHAVALVRGTGPFDDATPMLSRLSAVLDAALGQHLGMVTTRDGQLVIVVPVSDDRALDAAVAALHRALTHRGSRQPRAARMALGRTHVGPSAVARSYTEASEALDLAERLHLLDPIVRAADLLVYQVLLRDRAALRDLVEDVLAPLHQARGGAGPLLDTLDTYVAVGGNTTRTGQRLHLSVRAVTYRLHRIAMLTGRNPADPADRYVLHTAVLGARALGWPTA